MSASQATQLHPTLLHSTRQIRLLSVNAAVDGRVACEISVFDLSDSPKFVALSYVWGPEGSRWWCASQAQHTIYLNGQVFPIRYNLYLALKSILCHVKWAADSVNGIDGY